MVKAKRLQPVFQAKGNFLVVVMNDSTPQFNDYQLLGDKFVRREKGVGLANVPQFIVVLTENQIFSGVYKRIESVDEIDSSLKNDCETAYCWEKVY